MANVDLLLKEFDALKSRRNLWEKMWELIARYVLSRKQGFTFDTVPGEFFVHGDVYDDTAALALNQMVSSLVGSLWKNGARTFRIVKPDVVPETTEVKEYYAEINRRIVYQMEHPRAGFVTSFQEYMAENGAFGTSGIGTFPTKQGSDHLVDYRALGLKHLWVCEDASGRVIKIFYVVKLNAFQLQEEYGDAVAGIDTVKKALETSNYETLFDVLWVIRPRSTYDPGKLKNNQNMAYESIHVLVKEKIEIRNSGFRSNPAKITRFYKNEGEEYGRSPAMEALPSIITANAFWEMITKATEKSLAPPLYLLDDGSFGGGIIDTSPNALNVLDVSSRITNTAPIGVIGTVGEMQSAAKMIEALNQQIIKHFFVDRLLDLNNQTRMTLGEAQIRNELRSDSLGSVFNRQIEECLTPTIERTIEIMVEAGEFGVVKGSEEEVKLRAMGQTPLLIPAELVQADLAKIEIYEIEYVSPAMRTLRSEELRGLISTWQFAGTFGAVVPEFLLMLDKKKSLRLLADMSGASSDVFVSDQEYEESLKNFMDMRQQQAQLEAQKAGAEIEAKKGSAAQQNAQAVATQMGGAAAGGQGMAGGGMLL